MRFASRPLCLLLLAMLAACGSGAGPPATDPGGPRRVAEIAVTIVNMSGRTIAGFRAIRVIDEHTQCTDDPPCPPASPLGNVDGCWTHVPPWHAEMVDPPLLPGEERVLGTFPTTSSVITEWCSGFIAINTTGVRRVDHKASWRFLWVDENGVETGFAGQVPAHPETAPEATTIVLPDVWP